MTIRHTRRAPLATLIAVAAFAMGASSAAAADGPPPQPDPRVPIAVLDTGMFEHEWLKSAQRELGTDSWDIEHDGYADAAVSATGGSRPFWPAAFDQVLA